MISSSGRMPAPKNGHIYMVLIVARISTVHQDGRSLADQAAICTEWCEKNLGSNYQIRIIQSQGSGERLDRDELDELQEAIRSGQFDLIIAEDLSRICRRNFVIELLELAEDNDNRVVMLNDNLDTINEDWRLKASFAAMHHELSNSDTSKRIRRSLRNRFQLGMIKTVPFGYLKPAPKALDSEVTKDPDAEPIIMEIISRLERGQSYSVVVDFLNANRVPTGQFSRSENWTVSLLSNLIHNPILKGIREANRKKTVRNNETGKRMSVNAPLEELLIRKVPHLAYLDVDRYDRLIRTLDAKNAPFRRKKVNGRDPRANVPKKRTRFPGQQMFCAICGHPMQWGGHGQVDHLVCKGAREYKCWQSATFDGNLASQKILTAVFESIAQLPDFTEVLQTQIEQEFRSLTDHRATEEKQLHRRIKELTHELERLAALYSELPNSEFVAEKFTATESELKSARYDLTQIQSHPRSVPVLPTSKQVRELATEAIESHCEDPYELSRLMRQLIPRMEAHPFRLCDGGAVVIRTKFQLNLCPLMPGLNDLTSVREVMTKTLEVDLFDPIQREMFREQIVSLRANGTYQRVIAQELGITQPAVQNALKLQERMDAMNLTDPYVIVTEPPADLRKMRRHRHDRYKFQPYDPDGVS